MSVTATALAAYTGVDVVMGAGVVYVVVDKSGCTSDCFVAIDPATGVMAQSPPPTLMHGDGIAGVAYASGSAWAFGRTGDVLQVDPSTSAAQLVARTNVMFEGAASHP
jgi:hypothetical protein